MRLLILLIILTTSCSLEKNNEYFEGQLIYKQTYTSDKISTDSLISNSPNGSYYLVSQRYYKGLTYGKDSALFILDGTTGKSLYKTKNDKGFSCFDYTIKNMEPLSIKKFDKIETINGFKCKAFEVTSNGRKTIYYSSIDYKFNPKVYSSHNKWNWNQLMEFVDGGVIIKSIQYYDDYSLIIELESLEQFKTDDKEFNIKDSEIVSGC